MKKLYITLAVILPVLAVLFMSEPVSANPSVVSTSSINGNAASTSVTYLTSGAATSTFTFPILRADQADLNLNYAASSTSGILLFTIEFSDDQSCDQTINSCNWFREDVNSVSGSVITHSGTTYHTWTTAVTATTSKNITIAAIGAKWIKFGFQAQTANGAFWGQYAPKSQIP